MAALSTPLSRPRERTKQNVIATCYCSNDSSLFQSVDSNRLGLRKIGRKIHPLFQLNCTSFLYRSSFPSSPTEYSYSSSIQTRSRIRKRPLMQELSLLKREGEREGERHEGNYLNRYVDSCARTTRLPGCIDDLSSPANSYGQVFIHQRRDVFRSRGR